MKRIIINLFVIGMTIFACVGVTSCGDDEDDGLEQTSTKSGKDPDGTIVLNMIVGENDNYYNIRDFGSIHIDEAYNFEGYYWDNVEFIAIGAVDGLSQVSEIPTTGWSDNVAVVPGTGYVLKNGNKYARLYVVDYTTIEGKSGATVKYQSPFKQSFKFAGGTGTESNPFQIKTIEQLYAIHNCPEDHFILMNDIDLTEFLEEENPSTLQTTSTTSISQIYFVICCLFGFIASGSTSLIQHFPGISSSYGFNAAVGAMMLSIGMVANSVAKIILGYLIDHFGSKKPILLHCLIMILSVLLFLFFHTPTMLYISAFLYGYIYSLANVAMVTLAKDLFGRENYSKTYPTFSMFGTVGTAVSASGIGYIYDFTHSYTPVFLLLLGLFILNTLFVLYCYRKPIQ